MNAAVVPTANSSPIPIQPLAIEGPVPLHLLIVDSDRFVREACKEAATALGYHTTATGTAEQAFWLIDSESVDVVLLDLNLPGSGSVEVIRQIKRLQPDIEVIVMTGNGTIQSAVNAMKAGAYEFVTKPFGLNELKLLLERVAAHLALKVENRKLCDEMKSKQGFGNIIGRTSEMDRLYRIIGKAAHSVHPVLILGESGTGKEMVARAIHYSGPFRGKPFVPVDCGSLVPTLIESELFGHVKGAFTGASHSQRRTARAGGGRNGLSGRNWGTSSGLAVEATEGTSGKRDSSRREHKTGSHQRADRGRHQSRSGAGGRPRRVPPRSFLPAQRS